MWTCTFSKCSSVQMYFGSEREKFRLCSAFSSHRACLASLLRSSCLLWPLSVSLSLFFLFLLSLHHLSGVFVAIFRCFVLSLSLSLFYLCSCLFLYIWFSRSSLSFLLRVSHLWCAHLVLCSHSHSSIFLVSLTLFFFSFICCLQIACLVFSLCTFFPCFVLPVLFSYLCSL